MSGLQSTRRSKNLVAMYTLAPDASHHDVMTLKRRRRIVCCQTQEAPAAMTAHTCVHNRAYRGRLGDRSLRPLARLRTTARTPAAGGVSVGTYVSIRPRERVLREREIEGMGERLSE